MRVPTCIIFIYYLLHIITIDYYICTLQGAPPATRAEADRLIDEIKASRPRRFDASDDTKPASEGQLHYLQVGFWFSGYLDAKEVSDA